MPKKLSKRSYDDFVKSKFKDRTTHGFDVREQSMSKHLFDWQKKCVRWAVQKGRAALFQDCGLGKTHQEIEWSKIIAEKTKGRVLVVAPLSVNQVGLIFIAILAACYRREVGLKRPRPSNALPLTSIRPTSKLIEG